MNIAEAAIPGSARKPAWTYSFGAAPPAPAKLEGEVLKADERGQHASGNLQAVIKEFDDRTRDGVVPYVEVISHAAVELARI